MLDDIPCFPLANMAFEKRSISNLSSSNFFEVGEDFLNSIGKMMRHPFNKYLFHVIVETQQNIGSMLGSGIARAR